MTRCSLYNHEPISKRLKSRNKMSKDIGGCHLHCFNDYIADMPRPALPVKRVCYADDITVWGSGPKIPQLDSMINSYLIDVSIYLRENLLMISAPKSTVTLFNPDKHQLQTHSNITLEVTQLSLERSLKLLGVIMDPSLSFHKHKHKRNNML